MKDTTTEPKIRLWICVHTAPMAEFLVRDAIRASGYPVLMPTEMREAHHARRTHLVERAVFPRYLFVGVPEGLSWYPIRSTRGVSGVLSAGREPRAVPENLVRLLRAAVDRDAFTKTADPGFKTGDQVRIRIGQIWLDEFVARVNAVLPNQRLDVVYDLFGKRHRTTITVDRARAL